MSCLVSRTLLSILADLNNAVVCMVSSHPLISKSSCPTISPLVTVPSAPITIGTLSLYIIIISTSALAMVFHWSLSDNEFPQVSRTLLILADFNSAAVRMVSTRPLFSKSVSFCTNPFVTLPSTTFTIGFTVTFMFQSFFFGFYYYCYYHYYYYHSLRFFRSLSSNMFQQFSENLQSVRADFTSAVVWKFQILLWSALPWVVFPVTCRQFQAIQFQALWPSPSCSIFFSSVIRTKYFSIFLLSMVRKTGVQSQVESYQRLKNDTWCRLA